MAQNQQRARANRPTPALDPRVPHLVQPFKRLVEEGIIVAIEISFTPTGTSSRGRAGPRLCAVEGAGLNETDFFPVGVLLSAAEKGNLITRPKSKKKGGDATSQAKPVKSLVKEDLSAEANPVLQARINMIAAACGGGPLVGRVRSAKRFSGTETASYQDWWDSADGDLRSLSLSVGKHYASFTDEEKGRLLGLQCPFRGTLEFKVSEEEEDSEEEG